MMDEPRRKRFSLAPLFGFLILVIVGAAAWLVAPDMIHWLAVMLPNFAGNELPASIMRPVFTGLIVLLALIALALFAALVTPKDVQRSSAAEVEHERDDLRRRQRMVRAQARKSKGRS